MCTAWRISGDLKWARGTIATPYGPIYVSWQRNQDGEMDISWSAPNECTLIDKKIIGGKENYEF